MSGLLRRFAPAAAVIGLVCAPYWRCAVGLALPYFEDAVHIHHPMKVVLARALAERRLPLWSPEILGGFPLLAEGQLGALYPPNLVLFGLLPLSVASGLGFVAHLTLAGIATYAFAGTLGLSTAARMLAAIAFALSGFFVGHAVHLNFVLAGAWLPLLFHYADKTARRGQLRHAVLWGAAWAMQLLASAPQIALYSAAASAAYYVVRRGPLVPAAVAVVSGAALAAAQMIPLYELAYTSARSEGLSYAATMQGSLPPFHLVTWFLPLFFGVSDLDRVVYPGEPRQWGLVSWWESSMYVGVVPIVLALFAGWARERLDARFFVWLGGVSLLIAFGKYTPVGWLLYYAPGAAYFRFPARFTFLTTFAVAMLAGMGLDRLRTAQDGQRFARLARNVLAVLAAFLVAVNVVVIAGEPWARPLVERVVRGRLPQAVARTLYDGIVSSAAPANPWVLAPLAILACAWLIGSGRLRRACLVLAFVDLYAFNAKLVPLTPAESIAAVPAAVGQLPREEQPYRTWYVEPIPRWWQAKALADGGPTDPTLALKSFLLPNDNMIYGVESIGGANLLISSRYLEILDLVASSDPAWDLWLDVLNVKYLIAPREEPIVAGRTRLASTNGEVWIYENLRALPRARLVHAFRRAPEAVHRLSDLPVAGWDPAKEVILEADPKIAARAPARDDELRIVTYRDREVVVRTSSEAPGLLVLGDRHYPGWAAWVDDEPAEIHRADYVFRAVALPAGDHVVRFVYRPSSLRLGLAVSAIAWAALLAGVSLGAPRSRSS